MQEEPLDLLDNPSLMVELSEDPVRLYLKEIGGIDLLDTDREFWLATRLEAARRIEMLSRGHPLARQGSSGVDAARCSNIYRPCMMSWRPPGNASWRIRAGWGLPARIWSSS